MDTTTKILFDRMHASASAAAAAATVKTCTVSSNRQSISFRGDDDDAEPTYRPAGDAARAVAPPAIGEINRPAASTTATT